MPWQTVNLQQSLKNVNIPKKSLLQGGKDGWYKMLGPNASKSQQFLLNKQGGGILPYVSDIQIIDRK